MSKEIFRSEALDHKLSGSWGGDTVLPNTFSLKIFILILFVILVTIISFLLLASYTERRTVSGYLTPVNGVVKVLSPTPGIINSIKITEGQHVEKDDELVIIQNELYGDKGDYDSQIKANLNARLDILNNQNLLNSKSFNENKKIFQSSIMDLQARLGINSDQIANIEKRITSAENKYNRYMDISIEGAISEFELQEVKDEVSELQSSLYRYRETKSLIQSNIQTEYLKERQLESQADKDSNEINLKKAELVQSLLEIEKQKRIILKSPVSGEITALNIHPNQTINSSNPLFNILPTNSVLKANLLIPPSDIGFIEVGQEISIRYDAFPFEKYGQAKGYITSISKTTVNPSELLEIGGVSIKDNVSSVFYLVDVSIENQYFSVDGSKKTLDTGMTLNADVILENRKLYQWLLEPLISLRERNN